VPDQRCAGCLDIAKFGDAASADAVHRLVGGIKPIGVIPDTVPLLDLDILAVGISHVLRRDALDVVSVEVDGHRGDV